LIQTAHNISLNKPLKITTKPPLADSYSPLGKASNQLAVVVGKKKVESDGQFNTLPRYNKPKTQFHTTGSDGFPPLGRINIRSLRPKSQSPTAIDNRHGSVDIISSLPLVSPPPSVGKPSFVRGHRREPSWRQVSMATCITGLSISSP